MKFTSRQWIWVAVAITAVNWALWGQWLLVGALVVMGVGFAVLRPLDRRANQNMK